jgi:hypothetical protein
VIAVELVEQLRSSTLRFGEVDRAVIIGDRAFLGGSATMPVRGRLA